MAMNAIRLNNDISVVVTFEGGSATQLTPRDIHPVEVMTCRIYLAKNLMEIGKGIALMQPDDEYDQERGGRLALTRAVQEAALTVGLGKEERAAIYNAFTDEVQRQKVAEWKRRTEALRRIGSLQFDGFKAMSRLRGQDFNA